MARCNVGAKTNIILLLRGERKVVKKHRITVRERAEPAGSGFVTARIPATAMTPEPQEADALTSRPLDFDVPRLRIARLIAAFRGKAPHTARGSGSYVSLANQIPLLIPTNQHHGGMGKQSPAGDLLLKGQLNRHPIGVDLYRHPQHERHDHRGLNRMSGESNDEVKSLAGSTKCHLKDPRAVGYHT